MTGTDGDSDRMVGIEVVSYETQQIELPRIRADLASKRSAFFAPRENFSNE